MPTNLPLASKTSMPYFSIAAAPALVGLASLRNIIPSAVPALAPLMPLSLRIASAVAVSLKSTPRTCAGPCANLKPSVSSSIPAVDLIEAAAIASTNLAAFLAGTSNALSERAMKVADSP